MLTLIIATASCLTDRSNSNTKHTTCAVFQSAPVVNYPNEHLYTRVTEFKYLTGQEHSKTSIVYEFPKSQGDAYYPVPRKENAELYASYKTLADTTPNVHFVGRLATYKYYNMDQIVAQALTTYGKIAGMKRVEAMVYSHGNGNGYSHWLFAFPRTDAVSFIQERVITAVLDG